MCIYTFRLTTCYSDCLCLQSLQLSILSTFVFLFVSHSIGLPLPLYLCVFHQSDTGAQCFGPTHHRDSHNCLTRENKFYRKSRILMDRAVFFLSFLSFPISGFRIYANSLYNQTKSTQSISGIGLQ